MIYFVQCGKDGPIKIGHTQNDVEGRVAQMQVGCPYELRLLWLIQGDKEAEQDLHREYAHENVRGEWFHPSEHLLKYINEIAHNRWEIKLSNKTLTIIESKDGFEIEADGWFLFGEKYEKKLGISICDKSTLHIDTNGAYGFTKKKQGEK